MSAPTLDREPGPAPPSSPSSPPSPSSPSSPSSPLPRAWRRGRLLAVALLLVALGAVLSTLAGLGRTQTDRDLDPRSAYPGGSMAVARILADRGVRLDVVTRSDRLAAATGRGGSTLVVTDPDLLGPTQLDRLRAVRADLVLVRPPQRVADALLPGVVAGPTTGERLARPGCDLPAAVAAGPVRGSGPTWRPPPGTGRVRVAATCYPAGAGFALVTAVRPAGRVTLLGMDDVLRNDTITTEGNAALALRLLGAREHLVWYVPDLLEPGAAAQAPTFTDLVPPVAWWVLAQLGVAAVVAMLWRARRFGPLVTEPLPVVVRAAETELGRARLYRLSRSRGRAAAVLRTATLRRLAVRLSVPAHAPPDSVVVLAAEAAGRDPVVVRSLLLGAAPAGDAALVRLRAELADLERAVAGGRPRTDAAPPPQEGTAR